MKIIVVLLLVINYPSLCKTIFCKKRYNSLENHNTFLINSQELVTV